MKLATAIVWALIALLVGAYGVDFVHRVTSPDLVAVSFAEGGDDAYYFFTVARNIAQGHGITIDGVHWTTGFQPLWGFLCAISFLFHSDRAAFVLIYIASIGLWLAGAWLFVRLVRRGSATPLTAAAAALIAVLFLGESQFSRGYFNGMETGLALTMSLVLMLAFHDYLRLPAGDVTLGRVVGLGVLSGLTMLARNDTLFLCGGLLAVTLFAGHRRQPVRDIAVIVVVASALIVPWLAYCQWASGNPMPQSGIATSVAVRGYVATVSIVRKILLSIDPLGFLKLRTLIDDYLSIMVAVTAVLLVLLTVLWRRARPILVPPAGKVLLGLGIAGACLLLYYPLVSSAGQFFERYFLPVKLLLFLLGGLLIARAMARAGNRPAVAALVVLVAAGTVGSNLYWIARDYSKPYRSHLGVEAYEIVRSPYAKGTSRLGMTESGRLGFLYPTRVVNLDGKMNVDALKAVKAGTLGSYIDSAHLDYLMLHDEDVEYLDKTVRGWRDRWRPNGTLGEFDVFERVK
ncbi:MAG: hypothetical protein JSR24_05015 [Proteobacteria bacterium]|nr:hypothetical protein [Pseudomonadota bacterium]